GRHAVVLERTGERTLAKWSVGVLGTNVLLAASVASTLVAAQSPAAPAFTPAKTSFGQPDLQGVWQAVNTAAWDIQDHSGQRFPGLPARFSIPAGAGVVDGNAIPYQPGG